MPKERFAPMCPYKRSGDNCILSDEAGCLVTNETPAVQQNELINLCAQGATAEYYTRRPSFLSTVDGAKYNFSVDMPDKDIDPYDGI